MTAPGDTEANVTNDPTARRMIDNDEPDAAISAALERLQASRHSMRLVMIPPPRVRTPRPARPPGEEGGGIADLLALVPAQFREWAAQAGDLLQKNAVSSILLDAASGWWRRHPMRAAAGMAAAEVSDAVSPLIRRHPIAAVAIASFAGALVMTTRPWRWRILGGSTRPLPRRLGGWLMAQVPLQAALGTLVAVVMEHATSAAHKAAPGKAPSAPEARASGASGASATATSPRSTGAAAAQNTAQTATPTP